jgi:hypothetical protein
MRDWKKATGGKGIWAALSKPRGLAALVPAMILLADGRPRNPDGQFVANETGGADPQSMHAAYGPGAVAAIAGTTGAAGLGAGLTAGKIKRSLARFAK